MVFEGSEKATKKTRGTRVKGGGRYRTRICDLLHVKQAGNAILQGFFDETGICPLNLSLFRLDLSPLKRDNGKQWKTTREKAENENKSQAHASR